MSRYLTATAAQMDSERIRLHNLLRRWRRARDQEHDPETKADWQWRIDQVSDKLDDLEGQYTRRFLDG